MVGGGGGGLGVENKIWYTDIVHIILLDLEGIIYVYCTCTVLYVHMWPHIMYHIHV